MKDFLFIILLALFFQNIHKAISGELPYLCRDFPVLFEHREFSGKYLKLTKSIGSLNVSRFGNKSSSLCVPEDWELAVYKYEGFCSSNYHIKGPVSISDLESPSLEIDNWNDSIKSVKVIPPSSFLESTNTRFGELSVKWAGVVDNAEEAGLPHGPYGNLHILIYDGDSECPANQKRYPPPLRHIILPGPHPTGKKCEWDDGDHRKFDSLGLFEWRSEDDKILVFIYESDGKTHGKDWDHDPVFCQTIERQETLRAKVLESPVKAGEDAIARAINRKAEGRLRTVLQNRAGEDIGMMFIELETVPKAATYNDRNK